MGVRTVETCDGRGTVLSTETFQTSPEEDNLSTLESRARQALDTNRTYIGLASPTAAQTTAQVKALSRQNNALIRLLLGQMDGTD